MEMPKEIRTERLLLRPLRLSDIDDVYQYAKDPEWALYFSVPQPYSYAHAEEFVAGRFIAPWSRNPTWAIVLERTVIGGINLYDLSPAHFTAGLGYAIARAHWSKGLATEAVTAVLAAAFKDVSLRRIWAMADVRNIASQRVMQKVGMVLEGVLRQERLQRGEPIDMALYAILREDWEKERM